jgi:Predicted acyltransferase
MTKWTCKKFEELTKEELYKIIQLRLSVFAVEQNCPYQDCDDKDQASWHMMGWQNDQLIAYSRLIPPGIAYEDPSIGRVVTATNVRGTRMGKELMARSVAQVHQLFGKIPITISAQLYLTRFYESVGFTIISDVYLEDRIDHIKMRLS